LSLLATPTHAVYRLDRNASMRRPRYTRKRIGMHFSSGAAVRQAAGFVAQRRGWGEMRGYAIYWIEAVGKRATLPGEARER
jgi:hypothetical protein